MAVLAVTSAHDGRVPGYQRAKADHLTRLAKIEGQVRGVARMVEGGRYCVDVLTQITAVNRGLQEVAIGLLDDHLRYCVLNAVRSDPGEADAKLRELTGAFRRTLRV